LQEVLETLALETLKYYGESCLRRIRCWNKVWGGQTLHVASANSSWRRWKKDELVGIPQRYVGTLNQMEGDGEFKIERNPVAAEVWTTSQRALEISARFRGSISIKLLSAPYHAGKHISPQRTKQDKLIGW